MRVLIISHMYPKPYNEVNGIFVHEQVKALAKKGIEVKVVSPTPWSPYPLSFVSSKWKGYKNVPHYLEWEGILFGILDTLHCLKDFFLLLQDNGCFMV